MKRIFLFIIGLCLLSLCHAFSVPTTFGNKTALLTISHSTVEPSSSGKSGNLYFIRYISVKAEVVVGSSTTLIGTATLPKTVFFISSKTGLQLLNEARQEVWEVVSRNWEDVWEDIITVFIENRQWTPIDTSPL